MYVCPRAGTNYNAIMQTTNNQVVIRDNGVDTIAHVSMMVEGIYQEATVARPRTCGHTPSEMVELLQEYVWWVKLTY